MVKLLVILVCQRAFVSCLCGNLLSVKGFFFYDFEVHQLSWCTFFHLCQKYMQAYISPIARL